ncbi:uncharacterized protein LOC120792902 isoform X2 [Xiphias gladius]|uniref:uncharacterized protein LOC120792902 isoform X2 n=1 Tax=Xiphias gladius TaxID=8245 RepID=UPI001A9A2B32|nr:uncharacterized protein LOC120792902 isoform X2 [Xiphias gladius]
MLAVAWYHRAAGSNFTLLVLPRPVTLHLPRFDGGQQLPPQVSRPPREEDPEPTDLPLFPRLEEERGRADVRADAAEEGGLGGRRRPHQRHVQPRSHLRETVLQTLPLRTSPEMLLRLLWRPPAGPEPSHRDPLQSLGSIKLNLNAPPLKDPSQTSEESSSSSRLSCVRLQRRIKELEEKLFHLAGQQEDMQT